MKIDRICKEADHKESMVNMDCLSICFSCCVLNELYMPWEGKKVALFLIL